MTATNDAPEPCADAQDDRWRHIEERLSALERRIREHGGAALTTIDACLARLDALRHELATRPWPPTSPDATATSAAGPSPRCSPSVTAWSAAASARTGRRCEDPGARPGQRRPGVPAHGYSQTT
ncbi:hypothetical protein [Kitasatospora sp. NPDC017646]|uniref:hypothetical protein n=1 Tax=Kitasatospora sp. NPDC017646 TaxID=3364024 RepID=UPI0037AED240